MSIYDSMLWKTLKAKAEEAIDAPRGKRKTPKGYLDGVCNICDYALERAGQITLTFPMYTPHDEGHICTVLAIMAELLGERIDELTRDEAAMLLLAACCHDMGMSFTEAEQQALLEDRERLDAYLNSRPSDYVQAYRKGTGEPEMSDAMLGDYMRSICRERLVELLGEVEWPKALTGRVDREELIAVCLSHGETLSVPEGLNSASDADLRLCAVLLHLADILAFDTARAPEAVYEYCGFDSRNGSETVISREEWERHSACLRFDFSHLGERSMAYDIPYTARCTSPQVEQSIRSYLDWTDQEMIHCNQVLRRFDGHLRGLILPAKIQRNITADGYVSGEYRLTMDQSQVLNLLVGEDLYDDPSVFARELIQNAIDAVRTRQKLDKNLPKDWKPQINIRTWMDEEGYHWFRIEDNGTGMTEDIIRNHLLKVGSSYYTSPAFQQEKLRCNVGEEYTPISRFGIGILSCFMGDVAHNRVEISTKRFQNSDTVHPALRLRMDGMSSCYVLTRSGEHSAAPMVGQTDSERQEYLTEAGTVVAVRTNLYQNGKYRGFREIVDEYVLYPPVPIHYDGPEGEKDYITEGALMKQVHAIQAAGEKDSSRFLFRLSEEQIEQLRRDCPEMVIEQSPVVHLGVISLEESDKRSKITGAVVTAKVSEGIGEFTVSVDGREHTVEVSLSANIDRNDTLTLKVALYENGLNGIDFDTWGRRSEWAFPLCGLRSHKWLGKYIRLMDNSFRCFRIAHNGIRCKCGIDDGNSTVLLLRDDYRPELGMERDEIRRLPVEAYIDLELIRRQAKRKGYSILGDLYRWGSAPYQSLTAKAYLALLQRRPDFARRMSVSTVHGELTLEELEEEIRQYPTHNLGVFEMQYLREILDRSSLSRLVMAHLQSMFTVTVRFGGFGASIRIKRAAQAPFHANWDAFPPAFFLPPEDEDCPYLTTKDSAMRAACCASHRIARFMLDNADALQRRTPGVFREMLNSLARDSAEEMIPRINGLLRFLRELPGTPIPVSDDLMLTERDFCI